MAFQGPTAGVVVGITLFGFCMAPFGRVVTGRLQDCHNPHPGVGGGATAWHSASFGMGRALAEFRIL
jgi:hypothetical protein